MTRVWHLAKALGALVVLLALVGGIPFALVVYIGWPLPHDLPSWSQFTNALSKRGIPDATLLKALAIVVWVAWASLVAATLEEGLALARGRAARRLPLVGLLQPFVGQLLAALLLISLTGIVRSTMPSPHSGLVVNLGVSRTTPAITAVLTADLLSTPRTTTPMPGATPTQERAASYVTYTVRSEDTLWGIAAKRLGDAEHWKEIFELNRGLVQANGRSLTNPHWIYPGWVLRLPVTTHRSNATEQITHPTASGPTNGSQPYKEAVPTRRAESSTTSPTSSPVTPSAPQAREPAPHSANSGAHAAIGDDHVSNSSHLPVRLPSGSLVAESFVAAILALLAVGRLRRRHAYRYRPPRSGRVLDQPTLGPTLRALHQSVIDRSVDEDKAFDQVSTNGSDTAKFTTRSDNGLAHGQLDATPVDLALERFGALAILGPSAHDVLRSAVLTLIVRRELHAVELVGTTNSTKTLLPGIANHPAFRTSDSNDRVVQILEAELVARSRRISEADLRDVASYRATHREDPLPTLVALVIDPSTEIAARLDAVIASGSQLDIVLFMLGAAPSGAAHIEVDDQRRVVATSSALDTIRVGTELLGLNANEATELLATYIAALPSDEEVTPDPDDQSNIPITVREEAWPAAVVASTTARPIDVQVFGAFRIFAHGQEITKGRRRAAKELLAWYLLRPEGATAEAAVDAIWPETEPDRVSKRFWLALGDLRTLCRDPTGERHVEVLTKRGGRYMVDSKMVTCDLWDFQEALK